jgi:hypothetical protein
MRESINFLDVHGKAPAVPVGDCIGAAARVWGKSEWERATFIALLTFLEAPGKQGYESAATKIDSAPAIFTSGPLAQLGRGCGAID